MLIDRLACFEFPGGTANAGDIRDSGLISGSPGEGNATHSSILAWKIPWAEEPGL